MAVLRGLAPQIDQAVAPQSRGRLRREAEAKRKQEEDQRLRKEAEAKRKQEEGQRLRRKAEAKHKQEEEERLRQEAALQAYLQQAVLLKKVVDAMKDLCKDTIFDCSEKGLAGAKDSSHVALVPSLLRESDLADCKCDRAIFLGMNVDSLSKILKVCGSSDSLKLRLPTYQVRL